MNGVALTSPLVRLRPDEAIAVAVDGEKAAGYVVCGDGDVLAILHEPGMGDSGGESRCPDSVYKGIDLSALHVVMTGNVEGQPGFKRCNNCGLYLPATQDYFYFRYGKVATPCKNCKREYQARRKAERQAEGGQGHD